MAGIFEWIFFSLHQLLTYAALIVAVLALILVSYQVIAVIRRRNR